MELLLIILIFVFYAKGEQVKAAAALAATFAECDAADSCMQWIITHPEMHIGDHSAGRRLVEEWIVAHDEFCRTHPGADDAHKRAWLRSLLKEGQDGV